MLSNSLGRRISGFVTVETEVVFHGVITQEVTEQSSVYLVSLP